VSEDAEILKKVALHSAARALARNVFPFPGGPNNNNPITHVKHLYCLNNDYLEEELEVQKRYQVSAWAI
jgi:hypothetical protein